MGDSDGHITLDGVSTKIDLVSRKVDKLLKISAALPDGFYSMCPSVSHTSSTEHRVDELVQGMRDVQTKLHLLESSLATIGSTVDATLTTLNMDAVQVAMQMSDSDTLRFRDACVTAGILVPSADDEITKAAYGPSPRIPCNAGEVQQINVEHKSIAPINSTPLSGDNLSCRSISSAELPAETELTAEIADGNDANCLDSNDVNSIDDELRIRRARHAAACKRAVDPAACAEVLACAAKNTAVAAPVAASAASDGHCVSHSNGKNGLVTECTIPKSFADQSADDCILKRFPELSVPANGTEHPSDRFNALNAYELVDVVVRVHEQRVGIHRAYDNAFRYVRGLGDGGTCPAREYAVVATAAAARFEELSLDVCAALRALDHAVKSAVDADAQQAASEAAALVRSLHTLQRERAQLTAAAHQGEERQLQHKGSAAKQLGNTQKPGSLAKIRQRLALAAEEVEETVSELRHCRAELQDIACRRLKQ